MTTYYLNKGGLKVPVGTTPPAYDATQKGYVTDVGVFSTTNPNDFLVTAENEVSIVSNSPSIMATRAAKSSLPIPVVVTAAAFNGLWTSDELTAIPAISAADPRVAAIFAAATAGQNIDFSVRANQIAVAAALSAMPTQENTGTRLTQIITGMPA